MKHLASRHLPASPVKLFSTLRAMDQQSDIRLVRINKRLRRFSKRSHCSDQNDDFRLMILFVVFFLIILSLIGIIGLTSCFLCFEDDIDTDSQNLQYLIQVRALTKRFISYLLIILVDKDKPPAKSKLGRKDKADGTSCCY